MIYPKEFEVKTGFNRIKDLAASKCVSSLGIKIIQNATFQSNFELISQELNLVEEFRNILIFENDIPLETFEDCTVLLKKSKIEGAFLEINEWQMLHKSLLIVRKIHRYIKQLPAEKYPNVIEINQQAYLFPFVYDAIQSVITETGEVKDNASPELSKIRIALSYKMQQVNKKIHAIFNQAKESGIVESDATLSVRNGRLVIPVLSANKRKINGYVHDESATGKTCYIEPAEIVELNNEIQELEYSERREIVKILTALTEKIAPYSDDLALNYLYLSKIDALHAKALLALDIKAILPIINPEPMLTLINAVHPLLYLTLKKEKKNIVPLSLELDKKQRILIISGPNAGGKSVCLKTVGLLQYMMQSGFLIPANETSEMGIFSSIFINIGDEQSLDDDLSTYSSHLNNMKYFTRNADNKTLILIDEFGTGTEPVLGGAIAEAVLEKINSICAFGVITTHYSNLKHFATSADGVRNAAMLYDTQKMEPLFKLDIGSPGSSFAFEIARKIGLDEDILKSAEEKIGKDHIHFDKNLREIARDKRYWENKRDRIKQNDKHLEALLEKHQTELNEIKLKRKEIIEKAKADAIAIVKNANKEIENTIRQIRESQADKEKIKLFRQDIQQLNTQLSIADDVDDIKLQSKIDKIKERQQKREKHENQTPDNINHEENKEPDEPLKQGDKVRIIGQNTIGNVIEISGNQIMMEIGQMITRVNINKIEKISNKEFKLISKNQPQISHSQIQSQTFKTKLEFKTEIDIRGKRVDEALRIIQKLVDDAIVSGAFRLRILHGKGDGILRQVIRQYLATEKIIKSFKDEEEQFGGAGITIVELDF